jgi:hypothetical protein
MVCSDVEDSDAAQAGPGRSLGACFHSLILMVLAKVSHYHEDERREACS